MGDAVLYELGASGHVAQGGVPGDQIGLGVEGQEARCGGVHVVQQHAGQAVAPGVGMGHHPADPAAAPRLGHDPQVGDRTVPTVDPHVAGTGLYVPAVQFRVGALLLGDEHVHPEPNQVVERGRVQLIEAPVVDLGHGRDASPDGFAPPGPASEDGRVPIASLPSGIALCPEAFGDPGDPAVLLMHGLGSQLLLWEEGFCEGLAATGFRVVRYDQRDSGWSTILEEGASYTLSDMALDAVGLLDHLEFVDVHVVGLSLGGMTAQVLAAEHPQRCRSLVSMASHTGDRRFGRATDQAREAMGVAVPEDPVLAAKKNLADRRVWASVWHDDDHAGSVFAAYAERSVQPHHAWRRQARAAYDGGSREDLLATIRIPTLVLHGTADTLITPSGGERTAAVIPGADFVLVDGWGHDLAPGAWPYLIDAISTHCHRADGTT